MRKLIIFTLIALTAMLFTACDDSSMKENDSSESETGILYGFPSGPLLAADSPTDLTIDGLGFFVIRDPLNQNLFYTRLGAFYIDDEGYLVTPQGYIVQGWNLEQDPLTGEITLFGSLANIQIPPDSKLFPPLGSINEDSISIDKSGVISCLDQSGKMVSVFCISLANFFDNKGLIDIGENIFQASEMSGDPIISEPEKNGLGSIENYTLEGLDAAQSYETYISIEGQGYIILRHPESPDQLYYTSAGYFRFDKNGQMVNSKDYIAQGWALVKDYESDDFEISGSVSDIEMRSFLSQPFPTDLITVITNLDAGGGNNSPGLNALSEAWDGDLSIEQHIDISAFEYQTTIKVFDILGSSHGITIYFDKGDTEGTYEYIITCNPLEDIRFTNEPSGDSGHGLLGRGVLYFTSEGELSDLTFEQLAQSDPGANGAWDFQDVPEELYNNHFQFSVDFLGVTTEQLIEINFGAFFDGSAWVPETISTTFYPQESVTLTQYSNGYGAKSMIQSTVDRFGVITGSYTDNIELPLFRVALALFQNPDGLEEIDQNIFMETSASGTLIMAAPDTSGLGTLSFQVQ